MSVIIIRARRRDETRIERAIKWYKSTSTKKFKKFDDLRTQDLPNLVDVAILVENKYYNLKHFSSVRRKYLAYLIATSRPRSIDILIPILLQPNDKPSKYLDWRVARCVDIEVRCYFKNLLWIKDLRTHGYVKVRL